MGFHCETCSCTPENLLDEMPEYEAPPPDPSIYLAHAGVTWQILDGEVKAGPLCNRCKAKLQYQSAKTGGVSAIKLAHIVGHNRGYLVCPNCGAEHLLGGVPRPVSEARAEVEAQATALAVKGAV